MRWLIVPVLIAILGCRSCPVEPVVRGEIQAKETPPASAADIVACSAEMPQEKSESVLPSPARLPENAVAAGEPIAGGQPVSLSQLEQLALTRNPTIPQAAALVQQQQGLRRQAGLYPNPVAGYLRTDADKSGQSQTDGVFLGQEFVTAGKLRLARAEGGQEVRWRNWQLSAQQFRVVNDVRIRFYELLGARAAVRAATELVGLAEEGLRSAEQLLQAKHGSRPDVLQAEIQLSLVRTSLQDAQFRENNAWQQLANAVGVPDLPPAPLAGNLQEDIDDLDWSKNLEKLLDSSPLLKAQEAEIAAAQYELKLARAQAIPNVNVQLVAQRDHIMKYSTVSTLVSLPIPLFNRNQGNIVNAEGLLRQAQREYDRLRLALTDQLSASLRSYRTLRAQAERLRNDVLPKAKENLDLTTAGYKLRRFDFPRVLSARQMYAQTSVAYIDALTELHKVRIEIEGLQLTGALNPTEVGTALQTAPGAASGMRGLILQQLQEQGAASRNLPGAVQAGER
jgi:cobalt-zinc-cadmium efflux system outer membrane protein